MRSFLRSSNPSLKLPLLTEDLEVSCIGYQPGGDVRVRFHRQISRGRVQDVISITLGSGETMTRTANEWVQAFGAGSEISRDV